MKNSIIGKKYYPFDNSYCVNLTTCSNYPYKNDTSNYLAGTLVGKPVKECVIVSEPFTCKITTCVGNIEEHEMILVNYEKYTYSTLFHKDDIKK